MPTPATVTPDPTTDKLPRRRRWVPLSLRMFVGFLAILVGAALWIGVPIYGQLRALSVIERRGGWYMSNWKGPDWLCRALGTTWNDRLGDVTDVFLDGTECMDADLARIATLESVERLSLDKTRITDAGLIHLQNMKNLQSLSLDGTDVTDSGLLYLRKLEHLRSLDVNRTKVTDTGIDGLKNLPELHSLSVWETSVTDAGAVKLKRARPGMWIGRANDGDIQPVPRAAGEK